MRWYDKIKGALERPLGLILSLMGGLIVMITLVGSVESIHLEEKRLWKDYLFHRKTT
jgi:hypothetical protein